MAIRGMNHTSRRSIPTVLLLFTLIILLVHLATYRRLQKVESSPEILEIPANIIQKSPTKLSTYETSSFLRLNPNHTYYSFGDKEADEFIQKHMPPNIVQVYMSMPKSILKANLFRVIAVMILGGVYSDKDTDCVRPINTWINENDKQKHVRFIIGIEWNDPNNWKRYAARPLQFCMWTFAAVPGHSILRNMVKKVVAISPRMHDLPMSYDSIMNWAGSGMWTDVILDYLENHHKVEPLKLFANLTHPVLIGDDVYVLPKYAFASHFSAKRNEDPEARIVHYFEGSWKKDKDMKRKLSN